MQRLAYSIAAVAAAACVTTGAYAQQYKFAPKSTTFTATGPASITSATQQLQCTLTMKMKTSARGKLKILSATFSGDSGCGSGENLPWKVKEPTFNSAKIVNFEFTSSLGDCSYPLVPMLLDAGTIIIGFQFPDCGDGLGAELQTTPTLMLVPR
jgi:hypothetical protein